MNDAYVQIAALSAAENELISEGIRIKRLEPSEGELFSIFEHISLVSTINLHTLGYESKPSNKLHGYSEIYFNSYTIFVPYTLSSSFPLPEALENILEIGKRVSVCRPMQVLVSGSGALSGDLPAIGDLDFCEYFERFDGGFLNNLQKYRNDHNSLDEFCPISIKWNKKTLLYPFEGMDNAILSARKHFSQHTLDALQNWKFDHVGRVSANEILAITNMSIPVAFDSWEATATGRSWAFQEALISETGNPPRELTSFSTLGAYINWLREECKKYVQKIETIPKAAKRAYSLANALFLLDRARDIRLSLSKPAILSHIASAARLEAINLLKSIGHEDCAMANELHLEQQAYGPAPTQLFKQETANCKILIERFMNEVDERILNARANYVRGEQ